MLIWDAFIYSIASIIFLMLVFIPLEKVYAAKPGQKILRAAWFLDLCYFTGQYVIWNALLFWLLVNLGKFLDAYIPGTFSASAAKQSFIWQALEVIILSDFLIYWGHRLQHKFNFLWNFHKVHHSAEHLDWLAAHREHPLDTVYTVTLINLPALLFGFSLQTIAAVIAFRGLWAIYIHSNVRLPLPGIRMLIGAPELHHWHHDKARDAGNYANISPLMDILFGTYTCPDHEPEAFGISEYFPKTYIGQLIYPLLPQSWALKIFHRG
jgi:sterol desaturase/sphingolipid hydroxylase (fatty acid hydroxylase superfamily)